MAIVAFGYGIESVSNVLVDDILLSLDAEPVVVVDDDINIAVDADDIQVSVDEEITIEVD